jgi:hypothetical protein
VELALLIKASMLNVCNIRFAGFPMTTAPSAPSKLNVCPTIPAPNVAVPCNEPLFPSAISVVLPSPGHQLTKPAGGGTQAWVVCAWEAVGGLNKHIKRNAKALALVDMASTFFPIGLKMHE